MRWVIGTLIGLLCAGPNLTHAGLFRKKSQPQPPERVFELLHTLKNHPRAEKRQEAAEALCTFDAQMFPEIVPALIEALRQDSSAGVRREAAKSLGHLRPPSVAADQALEEASSKDDSPWVRLQARLARMGYDAPEPPPPGGVAVPPPRPDGRLVPVPVPAYAAPAPASPDPVARPLPRPPARMEGPTLAPPLPRAVPKPPAPALVPIPPAEQHDRPASPQEGPILVPPLREP